MTGRDSTANNKSGPDLGDTWGPPARFGAKSKRPAASRAKFLAAGIVAGWVGLSSFAASGETATTAPPATEAPTTEAPVETTEAPAPTEAPPETASVTAAPVETTEAPAATVPGDDTTATTLSGEDQQEKDRAVANLNLAKAADVEIASELKTINAAANETVEKIAAAEKRIEAAKALATRSEEALNTSDEKQQEIEASLRVKAVEGFKTRSVDGGATLFNRSTVNESIRQNQLLNQASSSTTELLEELRGLLDDRRSANLEAEQAAIDAQRAEQELQAELETLKGQQSSQLGLKAEAERRIDQWAGELTAYAKEDAAIQALIGQSATQVETAINNPTTPSALGFQWPVQGRATSEYGYRTHPVYGTRRLHAGIDVGAAGGTPITSSTDGTVIFSGTQGGYGSTVIVDHGGGITTLYAHMSKRAATVGQSVSRGEVIGYVGATGTATGNHLHFEVRVNGGPANPRNYLP